MKFEAGTAVHIVNDPDTPSSVVRRFQGKAGTVRRVLESYPYPYEVEFPGGDSYCFAEVELVPEAVEEHDAVNHPSHYTSHPSGVECKDIIGHYPFFIGSAMKYLWRAGLKPGNSDIQDYRKAIKNIEMEIERREALS